MKIARAVPEASAETVFDRVIVGWLALPKLTSVSLKVTLGVPEAPEVRISAREFPAADFLEDEDGRTIRNLTDCAAPTRLFPNSELSISAGPAGFSLPPPLPQPSIPKINTRPSRRESKKTRIFMNSPLSMVEYDISFPGS
ncbi:MAG: hypothetical protein HQM09_15480 [Candidatus Riflebacteria bacterium]|nr:hypothetical protein [Candidatus Riflebacteria bacterium]